jgi:hypothetical protein
MKSVKLSLLLMIFSFHIDAATIVLKNMTIKNVDIIDTAALYDSTKTEFIAMVSQQKYTLLKSKVKYIEFENGTLRFSRNIVYHTFPGIDTSIVFEMEKNVKMVKSGIAATGIGFGLKYCVAIPLFFGGGKLFIGGMFGDSSGSGFGGLLLLTASLMADLSGDALIVLGSTSCGFAASNSYNLNCPGMEKNINWVFYRTGLGLVGVEVISLCASLYFSNHTKTHNLAEPALAISILSTGAASAMFITSAINASVYTQKSFKHLQKSGFEIQLIPSVSLAKKSAGLMLNCSF